MQMNLLRTFLELQSWQWQIMGLSFQPNITKDSIICSQTKTLIFVWKV
jgi:hypothetical protein